MAVNRVGIGVDVHPFAAGGNRRLVIGGVEIAAVGGLAGHSDADVAAHALCDAMLGAAALGDLGDHFPDSDETWLGADSLELLVRVRSICRDAGWQLANADCTVVAERPRLSEARAEMGRRLSEAAGGAVHVKATRPEGLGSLGRVEGIACLAVAMLESTASPER